MPLKVRSAWPPATSISAAAPPLYGMNAHFSPVVCANATPERCGGPPTPDVAKLSCPGRVRASAISSFTVFTGTDGCTTSRCGE